MKKLELVTVLFEDFAGNFIFNLNCTMGKNISNNKRFIGNKLEASVQQEHFLSNMELLTKNPRIMEPLHLFLVNLGVLIGL